MIIRKMKSFSPVWSVFYNPWVKTEGNSDVDLGSRVVNPSLSKAKVSRGSGNNSLLTRAVGTKLSQPIWRSRLFFLLEPNLGAFFWVLAFVGYHIFKNLIFHWKACWNCFQVTLRRYIYNNYFKHLYRYLVYLLNSLLMRCLRVICEY